MTELERSDPHTPPLDNDDDARWLDPVDPRRLEVERRRGHPFDTEEFDTLAHHHEDDD
jgi:hypothetical protein